MSHNLYVCGATIRYVVFMSVEKFWIFFPIPRPRPSMHQKFVNRLGVKANQALFFCSEKDILYLSGGHDFVSRIELPIRVLRPRALGKALSYSHKHTTDWFVGAGTDG